MIFYTEKTHHRICHRIVNFSRSFRTRYTYEICLDGLVRDNSQWVDGFKLTIFNVSKKHHAELQTFYIEQQKKKAETERLVMGLKSRGF